MDISAINSGLSAGGLLKGTGPVNNSYDSATTAAEAASFEAVLKDLQKKAKVTANHVVNEAAKSQQDKELKEACKGFEAMFLNMMYKEMKATVPEDSLFGESNAQKIFRDMHDEKLMENIADGGGIGLADMLYKQLSPQVNGRIDKGL